MKRTTADLTQDMIDILNLTRSELTSLFSDWGYSEYHTIRLWSHLFKDLVSDFQNMPDLRPDLLQILTTRAKLTIPIQIQVVSSTDGHTDKYLLRLEDGQLIETVLMHYRGRTTICISTQVGCAMGCVFCATGQMGFKRQLSTSEIVSQFTFLAKILESNQGSIRNIVFMGMGEPLHNYNSTMKAVDILMDQHGLAVGPRYITISTVGLPHAIRRLADENVPVNLAVSLHAATDRERRELVPVNRKWSLAEVIGSCRYYASITGRRVFVEYALIAGKNDGSDQARKLGALLKGLDVHINLIPLNLTEGFSGRPSLNETISCFQKTLGKYDIPSTVRQRRGLDINAGCGQLRVEHERNSNRGSDKPSPTS